MECRSAVTAMSQGAYKSLRRIATRLENTEVWNEIRDQTPPCNGRHPRFVVWSSRYQSPAVIFMRSLKFIVDPPGKCRVSTLNYTLTVSFHILSNSLYTNRHSIQGCAGWFKVLMLYLMNNRHSIQGYTGWFKVLMLYLMNNRHSIQGYAGWFKVLTLYLMKSFGADVNFFPPRIVVVSEWRGFYVDVAL
jgi:hypothetical protein